MSSQANIGARNASKIVSGVQTDSPSPFGVSAGMGQRPGRLESHGPSNGLSHEPGLGVA
jgi:hypothetical protein